MKGHLERGREGGREGGREEVTIDVLRTVVLLTKNYDRLLYCPPPGKHKNYVRLCPCRKYRSGQIALPPPPL